MPKKATPRQPNAHRILDAALELAAENRWRDVTMERIAGEAGASLARVHEYFPSKAAFLSRLMRQTDDQVLSGHDVADADEPARERLLDVLMRRLDALAPHRRAIGSMLRDGGADPLGAVCSLPAFAKSMAWSLEAAGISSSGLLGIAKVKGLAAIHLSALRIWMKDETQDFSETMAYLDRNLRRAERLMLFLPDIFSPLRRDKGN